LSSEPSDDANEDEEEEKLDDLEQFVAAVLLVNTTDNSTDDDDVVVANTTLSAVDGDDGSLFDDIMYVVPTFSVLADNNATNDNDTELYADFLVDTSDNNDTAAAADVNGTSWGEEKEEELFNEEEEDKDSATRSPSSALETNVKLALGRESACVCQCGLCTVRMLYKEGCQM
jgi:hypothetical protein